MITLPNSTEDNTCATTLKRLYFSNYLTIKDKSRNKTLNTILGINGQLDANFTNMESFVSNARILFGVGNGGIVDNDLTISNFASIGVVAPGSTNPAPVTLSNPSGDSGRDHYNINSILPLKYTDGTLFDNRYGMLKRGVLDGMIYNKYYIKLAKVYISGLLPEDGGNIQTILQVHCILKKEEANACTPGGSGDENVNEYIDELALYFGRMATVMNKEKVVNGKYPTYNDFIQVVPFFYTRFDKIYLNDIPETGLDFMFEINLQDTGLLERTERLPGIENLSYSIS